MSYVEKNSKMVVGSITGIVVVGAFAAWQFYRFATFTNAQGVLDLQGGLAHLWWAIAMTVFAFIASFVVFSVFLRHDTDDELHINS
jgi:hypothetical protein